MSNEKKRSSKPSRRRRPKRGNESKNWYGPSSQSIVQRMMLQGESTVTSSGSGVVANTIQFDPSGSGYNFAEWASILALWGEIKFVSAIIQIIPRNVLTVGDPLYVAFRFDTNAAPSSYSSVSNLPSMRIYDLVRDTSPRGFALSARTNGPLNWSPTGAVVTSQYAGCPGCFQIYGQSFANSTVVATIRFRAVYAVRGRL